MTPIQNAYPPAWQHRGWTVTLDPTSHRPARYFLLPPSGRDEGWTVSSLAAAREVIATA